MMPVQPVGKSYVSIEVSDNDGDNANNIAAFFNACIWGNISAVKRFIQLDRDILTARDSSGNTAMHFAVLRDELEVIYVLLANEVSTKTKNHAGYTPLHFACLRGSGAAVFTITRHRVELLDGRHKADVSEKTDHNLSPMQCAAIAGHFKIVDMLFRIRAP